MHTVKLTTDEIYAVSITLNAVLDCLQWDEDLEAYTDGGDFVFSVDKEEYEALKKAKKKL